MNSKVEGSIAIVLALVVLLSSMWDPRASAAVSIVGLTALGIYGLARK